MSARPFSPLLALLVAFAMPASPGAASPGVIPPEMVALFPVGRTFSGVKIPSYTDSVLKTVLEADTVRRVDQAYLMLTNLVIKVYNGAGEVESTIRMDRARFHIVSRQMTSETPARIEHEKFVMTGDEMGFDTVNQISTLKGDVRVVIPEAGKLTGDLGRKAFSGE